VKVRYKQAALGAAWAILQPVLSMAIFTVVFGLLARVPSEGLPYSVFVLSGLVPWTYLANALAGAAGSLVGSANLITKVYFPRLYIPASAALAGLLDLAVAFPILLGLILYHGLRPGPGLALLPLVLFLAAALALGAGTWLAALNVKYRDVRYAIPFLIQVWMFATPVVYPLSLAPDPWRWLLAANPAAGLVEGFRAALLGRPVPWGPLGAAALGTAVLLAAGLLYFQRVERTLADVV
jgi:lipopolysaccharide transport system permease protein